MMDALFRLPNNDLSAALQKDKLFKEVEQQWNTVSSEEGNSRRKVDYEIYKSIVYNLEVRKVFLDPKLSLVKFSSIVGTINLIGSQSIITLITCHCFISRIACLVICQSKLFNSHVIKSVSISSSNFCCVVLIFEQRKSH